MSQRTLTIKTINHFQDETSWQEYKDAMKNRLGSLVNFTQLEGTGTYVIHSGSKHDGADSIYKLEVKDE